jgi:diguanylate cyclase (GGDEF)-like protein
MTSHTLIRKGLPLASEAGSRAARIVRATAVTAFAVWAVYLLYAITGPWGLGLETLFRTWIWSGLFLVAGGLCVVRAAFIRSDRLAWAILGSGMLSWGLATIYWSAFLKHLDEPPYPSVADGLYLAFYPAAYVALMLLARRHLRTPGPSVWLDGLIGTLAVGALGAAFLLPSLVADTGGSPAAVATNLAYPLGDLLLIALVVGVLGLSSWRPGRTWLLIGGGLVLMAIADSIYLYQVANETFVEGGPVDAIWPLGMVLLGFAAWQAAPRRSTFGGHSWPVLVVPSLFTLASLEVLVYGNLEDINAAALAFASATVVAAMVRLGISFREVRALSETRRQATTDELTGLANRRFLYERLEEELRKASAEDRSLTLVVADLDAFKDFNDSLGHQAGDLLLKQIGPRLLDALRAGDTLARMSGDEFGVLLPGIGTEKARAVVERMQAFLAEPFTIRGLTIQIEASFGIASFPEHATDAQALVQRADVAMYQAKQTHKGYEVYTAERDPHSRDRLSLLSDLRLALDGDELELHYQPKLDLRTRRIGGVEALVRWRHPQRGMLGPGEFLPVAEQTGLIRPLTLHVLGTALGQAQAWRAEEMPLRVAVNLSALNLLDARLPDDVRGLLDEYGATPETLQLEVTENTLMMDPARMIAVLQQLNAIGVGLSLDDFGTGTSSLSYLKRLPVDELKIDKSFVMCLDGSEADEVIVRTTIELGQRLGLRVVAEGVETVTAWERLVRAGCDEIQGFFLQRPLPAAELTRWLGVWDSSLQSTPETDPNALDWSSTWPGMTPVSAGHSLRPAQS